MYYIVIIFLSMYEYSIAPYRFFFNVSKLSDIISFRYDLKQIFFFSTRKYGVNYDFHIIKRTRARTHTLI